ncbi:MAG: peptidase [Anaerolineae bacterium]|nr:peptidase [Anaerolineae bacterium]
MPAEAVHVCIDRILSDAERIEAARRAVAENIANVPIVPLVEGRDVAPLELALETRTLWRPGRTLRVRFLDGLPEVQAKVVAIARRWMDHANIVLEFVQAGDAEIRISFEADDGSWSYIGTDALGIPSHRPTMNFGWLRPETSDIEYRRVVLHEFGHALGCIHEHQHPENGIPWDKEAVYRLYGGPPNNWTREEVDINLFAKYSRDQTQFSEFDPQSIMLYSISNALTIGDFEVGWNTDLSDTDKGFIGVVYPAEVKRYIEIAVGGEPVEESIGEHGEEDRFTFDVSEAGQYTVETRGWTDVVMGLFGPDDEALEVGQDDDSGRFLNARITRDLAPGRYTVRVRHYRPTGKGKYRILVRRDS